MNADSTKYARTVATIAGAALFSAATSSARPALRAADEIAVDVRVAGSGPPSRCPTASASSVARTIAAPTRTPAPITVCQMSTSASTSSSTKQRRADPVSRGSIRIASEGPQRRTPCPARAAAAAPRTPGARFRADRSSPRRRSTRLRPTIHSGIDTIARDGQCDLQRRRKRSMAARAERAPQRHGRAWRDGHQHHADLDVARQVEDARDDPDDARDATSTENNAFSTSAGRLARPSGTRRRRWRGRGRT